MNTLHEALGLPLDAALHIDAMHAGMWGRDLTFACRAALPDGATVAFRVTFADCREARWRFYAHDDAPSTALVQIALGSGAHRKPAQMLTDAFALSVLYGALVVERIA